MQFRRECARAFVAAACLLTAAALLSSHAPLGPSAAAQDDRARAREEAYRANNLGVALLEQFKPKEAAEQFRRALRLDPGVALARINLAIALFNVPDVDAAREEAEAASKLSPDAPQPHYILGLVARQQGRSEDALSSFRRVLAADPGDVGANVQAGQLLAQQREYGEAEAAFNAALREEPYNGTALYNLGTVLVRAGKGEAGREMLNRFQALRASGAATVVGQNYLEQGRYAEAVGSTGAEPDLVDKRTPEVSFTDATAQAFAAVWAAPLPGPAARDVRRGQNQRGRGSSDARRGSRQTRRGAGVWRWDEAAMMKQFVSSLGGGVTLFDYDGDGDQDIFAGGGASWRLLRNDKDKLADVTAQSGALAKAEGLAAVAGDFDNDERADIFVFGAGSCALYRNEGRGHFVDVTAAAKIPAYTFVSRSAAFLDYDHDGDLDIFVAGLADVSKMMANATPVLGARGEAVELKPLRSVFDGVRDAPGAPNLLLRNNGDGTFADVTAGAKLSGAGHAVAVVPTDYDNRRDVDLLVVNHGAPPALYRNMRDGTFRDVASEVGLNVSGDFVATAAGDFNKDGFTDFYFAAGDSAGVFAASDGRGRFKTYAAPAVAPPYESGATAAQFIDYDDDGLLDLVCNTARDGLRVLRNVGGGWDDVSEAAHSRIAISIIRILPSPNAMASADLDGDGDTDVLARDANGTLRLMRNDGGNRNRSLRVALAGKASNRGGVEAKIEIRAGSLRQKLETYAATPAPAPADVVFGLGQRKSADAVRVLWPSGVVQAETDSPATSTGRETVTGVRPGSLRVTELDRKPSSCPFLYAWNGERFEFITDFLGGGEMGAWAGPGQYNMPDPDEYVRIRGDQLRERGGRYELRVTNELEEALFVDRLQLLAVSHPTDVEVFPNEGLGNPTGPAFKLYATRGARPPRAATDEHGHDVLSRLSRLDRKYVDDFKLLPVRGYAAEHALTLDLGRDATLLLLTGWTDYAWSSDNVSASQRGLEMRPPSVQVKNREGKWRTVVESMGFPVGRPQTVTVDLAGKFLSESREVRIVTNMRVYWDQALVAGAGEEPPFKVERLEASDATLSERGFSAEVTPDGREPFSYDYARVYAESPWKAFVGRYTRLGDVRELLSKADDMFVVSKPGDEVALSFDASALAPLPAGWTRTFLLYADGFSKEMDINSASPHEVAPMPFHGMKRYPYDASQTYPHDAAHTEYLERYNTRVVASPLPVLSAADR